MHGYAGDIAIKVEESESREKNAIVALYVTHNEAEEAVRELHKSGFDMQKLAIVGMDHPTDGEVVGWIAGALEGAAAFGGVSALGACLYGVGIPKRSAIQYETQVRAGKFVVIAHGSPEEVRRTMGTLAVTKHLGIKEHACRRQATLQEVRTGDKNPAQPMIGEKTWRNTYF